MTALNPHRLMVPLSLLLIYSTLLEQPSYLLICQFGSEWFVPEEAQSGWTYKKHSATQSVIPEMK